MAMSQERKGTIAVSLTNFLDSGCIVASSVALTAWAAAFGFGSMWTSILGAIGANAFGAAIGALIGGFLTDKYGRTIIYRYNLLVYAIGVAIAMCAMNLPMVVVGVVLSGLSVGAGVPASWSYISETSTSTKRAANIGISQFAWSCGPAIIFLLSLALSFALPGFAADGKTLLPAGTYGPFDGLLSTRILFLVLLVVALVAWNLQRQLQELHQMLENIDEKMERIAKIDALSQSAAQVVLARLPAIYRFDLFCSEDISNLIRYERDLFVIVESNGSDFGYGLALQGQTGDRELLHPQDTLAKPYLKVLLKTDYEHIEQNNLQPFYEQIFDMGYSPGRTFGKVLVSAQEQELTNFYAAWIELISE